MRIMNESVENLLRATKKCFMLYKKKSSNEGKKRSCLASQCDSKSRFFGYTLFIIILDIYFILLPHTYRLTDLSCSKEGKN